MGPIIIVAWWRNSDFYTAIITPSQLRIVKTIVIAPPLRFIKTTGLILQLRFVITITTMLHLGFKRITIIPSQHRFIITSTTSKVQVIGINKLKYELNFMSFVVQKLKGLTAQNSNKVQCLSWQKGEKRWTFYF